MEDKTMFQEMEEAGSSLPMMVKALTDNGWKTYQHHDNWFMAQELPTDGKVHVGMTTHEAYTALQYSQNT